MAHLPVDLSPLQVSKLKRSIITGTLLPTFWILSRCIQLTTHPPCSQHYLWFLIQKLSYTFSLLLESPCLFLTQLQPWCLVTILLFLQLSQVSVFLQIHTHQDQKKEEKRKKASSFPPLPLSNHLSCFKNPNFINVNVQQFPYTIFVPALILVSSHYIKQEGFAPKY